MDGAIGSTNRVQLTFTQIEALIGSMFNKIKDVYDLDSPRLSQTHKQCIYDCASVLNNCLTNVLVTDFPVTHLDTAKKPGQGASEIQRGKGTSTGTEDLYADADVVIARKYQEFVGGLVEDESVKKAVQAEERIFCNILDSLPSVDDLKVGS
jgi:hypothetical protein